MQSGVRISCTIGIPLKDLLLRELAVPEESLKRIDVLLLDGKPVDSPSDVLVPDGARLALAAGLPGIAGLAMKSNSPVRGLRPGITYDADAANTTVDEARPGSVELVLYSLAIPLLAPHFLARGAVVNREQLLRYLRLSNQESYRLDGFGLEADEIGEKLEQLPEGALIRLSASFSA